MVNWSRLPDVIATSLLTLAFASVLRRSRAGRVNLWLVAWALIVVHFLGAMFYTLPGFAGTLFRFILAAGLIAPAVIFNWSTIPHRESRSSKLFFAALLTTNLLCMELSSFSGVPNWLWILSCLLLGVAPLAIWLGSPGPATPQRRITATGNLLLAVFLLGSLRLGDAELNENAILTWMYLATTLHFWWIYRWRSAGATITNAGFIAWFLVFPASIVLARSAPQIRIEDEIWNLPKYVVAVGMLLLLLEKEIEHTEHLALHDPLTGLPNRRYFQQALETGIAQARRTGSKLALLALDLDMFKEVNDSFGHHVGDELLSKIAEVLSARVRRSDVFARTGGDEFTLLLHGPASREDAEAAGVSLSTLLDAPLEVGGQIVYAGASIGVAIFPDDADDPGSLSIVADRRMYLTKTRRKQGTGSAPSRGNRWEPSEPRGPRLADAARGG